MGCGNLLVTSSAESPLCGSVLRSAFCCTQRAAIPSEQRRFVARSSGMIWIFCGGILRFGVWTRIVLRMV